MSKIINEYDLVGLNFGKLTVLECLGKTGKYYYYNCICECGNIKSIERINLMSGHTTSCGCFIKEKNISRCTTHGCAGEELKTSEYRIWNHIKERCNNPKDKRYSDWGGRGITICDEWTNSFDTFLFDMGTRPSPKHSIDRIDNNKGYYKENCKWSTKIEQGRNKRNNVNIFYLGETKCLSEWAEILGLRYWTLYNRIYRGWNFERALSTPIK